MADPAAQSPFIRAPEASKSIFLTIALAACGPLAAGVVFFGWRALITVGLSVLGCMAIEWGYYQVRRTPALLGRSHALLTGLLLGLTLPPFVPWYVPLVGAAFAILVGKALFGGVGHFLWQPALVGRLAVAVLFAPPLLSANLLNPPQWPVLAKNTRIAGDIKNVATDFTYRQWRQTLAPPGTDALQRQRPREILRKLTRRGEDPPQSIVDTLCHMPPGWDLLCGAHGGGIGETCTLIILVAGLYLVYRNFFRARLAGMFLLAAAVTAAVAPIRAADGTGWQWLPVVSEGLEVGFVYVNYHLACGEIMLAAWFLATEMTSRPVTAPGQAIFGIICGVLAILIRLYVPTVPIPAYAAVLGANTFTPLLDTAIQPRFLGQRRWWQRILPRSRPPALGQRSSL